MQNRLVKKAPLGARDAYALALAASVVALLVRLPFSSVLSNKAPYATFLIAAGVCASVGGIGPGLLATGLGALLASLFILPPFGNLPDFGTLVVYLGLGALISYVCARLVDATRQENAFRVLFQQTFVSIGDGVISVDNNSRVRLMNPVAEQLTGWTEAEARGKPIAEVFRVVHEGSDTPVETSLDRVAVQSELITRAGKRIPIDDSVAPFRNEKGLAVGAVLVFRDVKERRLAEASLRRSEEQSTLMLELLQLQRRTLDPDVMMNVAAETIGRYLKVDRLGFFEVRQDDTLNFLVGWTAGRLPLLSSDVPVPAAGIGTKYLEQVRAGRTLGISDVRTDALTADSLFSRIDTVALIGVPIIRHGRWHAGFYVNHAEVRDWTAEEILLVRDAGEQTWDAVERARAVAALRNREEQLRLEREQLGRIFAQAPVAIVVLRGRDLVIELANPLFNDLMPGRQLTGRRFADALPELGPDVRKALYRVLDTGEAFAAHDWHIPYDKDGDGRVEDHWFNLVYHPLRGANNSLDGIVAVCSEVTLQVLSRKELERVNRELEEFAYVASHDLQEPLRMVNIYTQMILKRIPGDDETLDQYAGFIRQGISRMDVLIKGLLTYSRTIHRDDLPVGTADLAAALAEACLVLKDRIEENEAKISVSPLPRVRGDTQQLSHVFQNLLSNALKYRRNGTPVEIMISARLEKTQWAISVQDNGIGFEQQYAERIFGLFKRLHKDEFDGTGLGLAICQRIVERYGGKMWAEGRPGSGATFHFSLPCVEE